MTKNAQKVWLFCQEILSRSIYSYTGKCCLVFFSGIATIFSRRSFHQTRWIDIRSHPGHYLVDPYTWPSDHFWLRYSKFHIWPWKFKVKVMAKVKPRGHIWGLEFNQYVCFFVSWQSDHFWLRYSQFHVWPWNSNSRSKSWSRSNQWSHLRSRVVSICLLFLSQQLDHFWLRYSKFQIWPWKFKVKVTTKINQI